MTACLTGLRRLLLRCLPLLLLPTFASADCVLTMGYRTNERAPLIMSAPDNSGLYLELYSEAAKRLGCQLQVVRAPKNRILRGLMDGNVDFYPGFVYSRSRAQYAFFIDNGLPGGQAGLSHQSMPEVTDLAQLRGKTVINAMGATDPVAHIADVRLIEIPELTLEKAAFLLEKGRADFYIYNSSSLAYLLRHQPDHQLKLHPKCCGGERHNHLAFSRASPHYREETIYGLILIWWIKREAAARGHDRPVPAPRIRKSR